MNSATQNLEIDHVHILRLIEVMEQITRQLKPNTIHLETIIDLIKNFADQIHHAKEENLLFPFMVEKGFSMDKGPVSVMVHEHEQGRIFVKGMEEFLLVYKTGDQEVIGKIYGYMHGYINLLRSHISKENNVLFRMADKVISDDEHKILLRKFEEIEQNSICGNKLKDCVFQIEQLASEYAIK
jgi:hemerythrin-like domain-containing protein